jgi:two-component system C4-dicarboxylate transport sensor histidine kinase DctB
VNLLRNAIDATKSTRSPEIEIILTKGKSVRLQVRDNGEGISEMDNLFEPFHTTKSPGDGVGLGLAISSGIVSDMGGRLTAHNHPEGGAVFEIELPIFNETRTETNFLEA